MRPYLSIIFIFLGVNAISQNTPDSAKLQLVEDSLTDVYNSKDIQRREKMNSTLFKNIFCLDTAFLCKDTLIVNYLTKDSKLIKQERDYFILSIDPKSAPRIKTDSIVTFYNSKGLVEYDEQWVLVTPLFDTEGEGQGGVGYLQINPGYASRLRVEYDDQNREILVVLTLQTKIVKIRRSYNSKGELEQNTLEEIKGYQFWDN